VSPAPSWSLLLLLPASGALALVLLLALRRPVLLRMALRNLRRRRAQGLAIALGLTIGTAIIAGSLAIGDSSSAALRDLAIGSFDTVDETVGVEGQLFFPESVAASLQRDPRVGQATDAVAPGLLEDVAVGNPARGQFEPRAALLGVDPAQDSRLGPFRTSQGLTTAAALGPGDVLINEKLAGAVQAAAGDTVTLRYAQRPEPLVPRVFQFNGSLGAAAGSPVPLPPLPGPLPHPPPPYTPPTPVDEAQFEFPVDAGAARVTVALLWASPSNRTDMDLGLTAPDGSQSFNGNGTLDAPDSPAILNASAQPGAWRVQVVSKAAVDQRFVVIALVFYEVHDLAVLQDFVQQLEQHPEAKGFVESLTGGIRLLSKEMRVRAVVLQEGRGGFLNQPDVWMRLDTAQELLAKQGRLNVVFVSNPGDAEQGLEGTQRALDALRGAIAAMQRGAPDDRGLVGLQPRPVKQEFLSDAERASTLLTTLLAMMGSFSILAGLILIVNTFVQLTEERRTELGIARALGLPRGEVVQLFLFEGSAYAVLAPALGVLLGLAVCAGLVAAFNAAGAGQGPGTIALLRLTFRPSLDSVLASFAAGVLMTLLAIALASQRAARLNIVRSIRRLEEPDEPLGRGAALAGLGLVLLGGPLSLLALTGASFAALILGPNLVLLGGAVLLARQLRRSLALRLAAVAILAYNLWTNLAFDFPITIEGMVVGAVRGVLIVLATVILLIQSRWLVGASAALLRRAPSLRPVARTAMAYPLHRKVRTGMTVVMFGLVLTVVVMFSIMFTILTPDPADQGGGFDVRAETTVPLADLAERLQASAGREPALADVQSVTSLEAAQVFGGRLITVDGANVRYHGLPIDNVYGFDEAFVRAQDFPLVELHPRFANARDAYEAVLRDPTLVIVSSVYSNGPDALPGVHHVGDALLMKTRNGTQAFTIVGIQRQVYFGGVFAGKPVVEATFESLRGLHLVKLRPGGDAVRTAQAMERSQQDLGLDAASVHVESVQLLQQQQRLSRLFEVYLGLGLVLGVASLGIITARSVLERRQEVGMLRAIGLSKRLVFRSFLIEGLFTFTLGALVGVGAGLAIAYGAHLKSLAGIGLPFRVPWPDIVAILLVAYVATVLATLGPARRAARLAPAEAIRYIE
jgi:putative ABC transport system permease protein